MLARLLATVITLWTEDTSEFLSRLDGDRTEIHCFLREDPGEVVEVESDLSDPHRRGRSVRIVRFASGTRVVYKSRALDTDLAWVALIETEPETNLLCSENPLSEAMRELFELPTPLFLRPDSRGRDEEVRSFMFLGNAGNVSSMHFDGDIAPLLHYQVFGRKRHILAEPRVAKKLMPIDSFSTVLLANFCEDDKERFIEYLDAYDCVLEPGETLFMPAQYWHHVEYVETAFSFIMRFGRNAYTRFLHTEMHRDMYRQNIAAKLLDPAIVEKDYFDCWNTLKAACTGRYESPRQKYRTIKALLKKIYAEICPDAIQEDYSTTGLHEAIEEKLVVDLAKFYQRNFAGNSGH